MKQNEHNSEFQPEVHEVSEADIDKARRDVAAKMQGHNWRQEGIRVYCTSCMFEHGFYVKPGIFVVGTETDGKPIFKELF